MMKLCRSRPLTPQHFGMSPHVFAKMRFKVFRAFNTDEHYQIRRILIVALGGLEYELSGTATYSHLCKQTDKSKSVELRVAQNEV